MTNEQSTTSKQMYYIGRNGETFGPYPKDYIISYYNNGYIVDTDYIFINDQWVLFGQEKHIFNLRKKRIKNDITIIDMYINFFTGNFGGLKNISGIKWIFAILLFYPTVVLFFVVCILYMIYAIFTGFWNDSSDFTKVLLAIFFW